jgi:hypothetical protein
MAPTFFVCAWLVTLLASSGAQKSPASTETVVHLVIEPMPAPRPALKYQLLPELKEMNPGNPIYGYLKCFGEQQNFFFNKTSVEAREKWETMPLKDLPLKELQGYGSAALSQADYAARLDTPDWQILLKAKKEGHSLLLPDLHQLRLLATALKVRFRAEVAERKFDDAVATAKTMLALARHLGEHPTSIGNLVGIVVANVALGPMEEMIQQPGCPNLYWAITDLPDPLVGTRKGYQGARLAVAAEFAGLQETLPMSEAELRQAGPVHGQLLKYVTERGKREMEGWLRARVLDEAHVQAARKRLLQAGLPEDLVQSFPALQVVLLDDKHEFEARLEEDIKWMGLPYWQAEQGFLDNAAARQQNDTVLGKILETLFGTQRVELLSVRKAQARLDQRIALLRHVEALRLYAANHEGKLPARLEDIGVPLSVDPVTGKPFVYRVAGETASLRGGVPKGEEANPAHHLGYDVTIQKTAGAR